jgi:nucleotide-binding universal stress UspA family protein
MRDVSKHAIHRVVVPVGDESDDMTPVELQFGRWLADRLGATFDLLHVVDDRRQRVELGVTREQARAVAPDDVVIEEGEPATEVTATANEPGTLVVLASTARTGLGWLVGGSVSRDVLTGLERPVVMVGPEAGTLTAGPVVVGVDADDQQTELTVDPARGLAEALSVDLLLVRVVEPQSEKRHGQEVSPAAVQPGNPTEQLASEVGNRAGDVEWKVVGEDDPAEGLVGAARDANASLVAMGVRPPSSKIAGVLGLTTVVGVVRHSPCPVLVIPLPDEPA